jgi:hypothetical protein
MPGPVTRQTTRVRSFRVGRWPAPDSQRGHMVIDALVRARLLGMQLLTLEARVIVETNGDRAAASSLHASSQAPSGRDLEPSEPELSPGLGSRYARAIELLDQGTKTLDCVSGSAPRQRAAPASSLAGRPRAQTAVATGTANSPSRCGGRSTRTTDSRSAGSVRAMTATIIFVSLRLTGRCGVPGGM